MKEIFEMLDRLYRMAVWDVEGRMYMPVQGYDGEWAAYRPAREALAIFYEDVGWTEDWE